MKNLVSFRNKFHTTQQYICTTQLPIKRNNILGTWLNRLYLGTSLETVTLSLDREGDHPDDRFYPRNTQVLWFSKQKKVLRKIGVSKVSEEGGSGMKPIATATGLAAFIIGILLFKDIR